MKKNVSILLIVLLILVISTLVLFAEEAKYDFRKTNWGMSKEQVRATEDKKPDFEDDKWLGYEVKINGKDFGCLYCFLEDKLCWGEYFSEGEYTNKNLYIDDYEELKEILTKKYGKPKTDRPGLWKNDLYKVDKSLWGIAISAGLLAYEASWETSTTEIWLRLEGDNDEISLGISYYSKELAGWVMQTIEKEASKGVCARSKSLIPANFTTYTDEVCLFRISYPTNWEPAFSIIESLKQKTIKYLKSIDSKSSFAFERSNIVFFGGVPLDSDGYNPNITVFIDPLVDDKFKLEDLVELSVQGWKKEAEEYREFSRTKTIIDGKQAIILDYEGHYPNLGSIHVLLMIMLADRFVWMVSCGVVPPLNFYDFKDDLYAIVKSFQILK